MADEKKIIFSGVDNTTQKVTQIYSGILAQAKKQTDNLKEQTSYINRQIEALKKKGIIEDTNAKKQTDNLLKEARNSYGTQRNEGFRAARAFEKTSTAAGQERDREIELLQELLNETKKENSLAAKAEADQAKNRKQAEDFKMREEARSEVRGDRKGVRQKVKEAERSIYEGLDENGIKKVKYQKQLLKINEGGGKDVLTGAFLGTLAAGITQQITSSLSKIISASSGEQGLNTLLGPIPVVGAANQRSFEEQYAVRTGELNLSAKTGRAIKGQGSTALGYSTRESLELTGGLMNAAGKAEGGDQTGSARLLQRGLGLSTQELIQIVKDTRIAGSNADMVEIVNSVISANPELKKDRTKLSEILGQSSNLINTLAQGTENVNQKVVTGMVGALRSVGGSLGGDPAIAAMRMNSINQSLTSPGSEYQKARNFGVLSSLKPGASYTELLEMQEKGLSQKGFLGGVVRQIGKEGGGGENSILSLSQNLNIPVGTARKMLDAYKKNPSIFDTFSGTSDQLNKMFADQGGITKGAEQLTSKQDRESAETSNKFLEGSIEGTLDIAGKTIAAAAEKTDKAMNKFGEWVTELTGISKHWTTMPIPGRTPWTNEPISQ